jgi:hypothetical protein
VKSIHNLTPPQQTVFKSLVKAGGRGNTKNSQEKQSQNNTAQRHMSTITHLVLELLQRLELFYGKQQTSRRNEMRDVEMR